MRQLCAALAVVLGLGLVACSDEGADRSSSDIADTLADGMRTDLVGVASDEEAECLADGVTAEFTEAELIDLGLLTKAGKYGSAGGELDAGDADRFADIQLDCIPGPEHFVRQLEMFGGAQFTALQRRELVTCLDKVITPEQAKAALVSGLTGESVAKSEQPDQKKVRGCARKAAKD